ncbi:hypothetical protein FQN54_003992 [Arachnomyces sp. PD_36]|nr:hypothetical protein FQN54_003992 [Arachnomyces sp. PD_36]
MKVLWLFAHPEQRSLSASLRDEGLRALAEDGHEHQLSDLYAMGWNPIVDRSDFRNHGDKERLLVASASQDAYEGGTLSEDIRIEQEKLRWADTVIVQFPFWWFGMSAILKGYFDRVFVKGFAYGVKDPQTGKTLRYGNGGLEGKRAMVIVNVGVPEIQLGPRSVDGAMSDALYNIEHGILFYTGMTVVPPFIVASADRVDENEYSRLATALRDRVRTLPTTEPTPFRTQNGGDYDENRILRPEIAPGRTDIGIHYRPASAAPACTD